MRLGIIGLAGAGKTTVFNAVTRGTVTVGAYSTHTQPNIGVVRIPDERVDRLSEMYNPKKTTYATVEYVDFPAGGEAFGKGKGPAGKFVNELATMDALIHVVRGFEDETNPHPEGSVDIGRDIETMHLELAFIDLGSIDRRIERLKPELRSMKAGERESQQKILEVLEKLKGGLEADTPVRDMELSPEEQRALEGSQFLTALPLLVLVNISDSPLPERESLLEELSGKYAGRDCDVAILSGRFEMELNELSDDDATEFREAAGITESGMASAIQAGYSLLGLISFLTVGPDECRAWTVTSGATAPEAAGKIHTDLQRGFIRAEVMGYADLIDAGSEVELKKQGLLRTEGKGYVVQDGDILNILFNV